ncbi:TSUP family transporter [Ramlibacter sp. G-1-2-2]|uniref:Probable membrane transporter protein n=1 Tax=Ramlibacter agri TaxID=2728837 RepID=A0A848H6B8_9BURK|nr:TSUP family transporter [Ramlibacter agri]
MAGVIRTAQLRKKIDWRVFTPFAVMSAVFTLAGALLQSRVSSSIVTHVFAALLVVSGLLGFTGLLKREHKGKAAAWVPVAGALVGVVAGLFVGQKLLKKLPQDLFDEVVSGVIVAVGVLLFFRHE